VSELDIFNLYCKDFKQIGRRFKSPILVGGRPNTGSEAANILYRDGVFKLYDYRAGRAFDSFSFAMLMTGLNFKDLIQHLCEVFGIISNNSGITPQISRSLLSKDILFENTKDYEIDVKYEPWTNESLGYWTMHGWQPYMLDACEIRPIERFWMSNDSEYRQQYSRPLIGPISFAYDFGKLDGIFRRKIYNPLAERKNLKWKNNTSKLIIQALRTIDYHCPTLYIVSSMKDCGPIWSINGKPSAIAPNSESSLFSPNQIRMIRQMSDKQIIWYDNDATGIANAIKQANLYGFEYMWNPIGSPKDQSDYVKQRGLNEFRKLIIN
jgi:hypothetical protein